MYTTRQEPLLPWPKPPFRAQKSPRPCGLGLGVWRLAIPYFRTANCRTIIGARRFHFRVRDGSGWCTPAMVTKQFGVQHGRKAKGRAPGLPLPRCRPCPLAPAVPCLFLCSHVPSFLSPAAVPSNCPSCPCRCFFGQGSCFLSRQGPPLAPAFFRLGSWALAPFACLSWKPVRSCLSLRFVNFAGRLLAVVPLALRPPFPGPLGVIGSSLTGN